MTQYANYNTDEGYYQEMSEQLKQLDHEKLDHLCNVLAPQVEDKYNELLFNLLYTVNNEQLDKLIEVWELLADGDLEGFLNLVNVNYNDLLNVDDLIYDYDTLEQIADEDLRTNGINANALYWYDELDSRYSYFVFNAYGNGLYCYDTINEALGDYIELNDILDLIKDYIELT
jgi:hypothetical protein